MEEFLDFLRQNNKNIKVLRIYFKGEKLTEENLIKII